MDALDSGETAVLIGRCVVIGVGGVVIASRQLWTLAALLFVLGTAATVFQSHAMRYIYQYGARKKGALTILILQKLLTLNQVARQGEVCC